MSLQELEQREVWQRTNGSAQGSEGQHQSGQESSRQRLRHDRGQGEDLFLSLALTESNIGVSPFSGNKRQSLQLPVKTNIRSPTNERPRSSGSGLGSSRTEAFPTLDTLRQPLPRRSPLQHVRDGRDTEGGGLENGRGTTPTPSQYTSRNSQYSSGYDQGVREGTRSSNMFHFGSRQRAPSNTFSDAVSRQRLYRIGGYDATREARGTPYDQEYPMRSPNTPGGHKRSDPETESVGSAAPSTVWDELDDLKSRIRNLELTGKAPSPSAAASNAHQSGDRPRTATTAPTTISSSPQHIRKSSAAPTEITVGGPGAAQIHPLLHSALAKAKPLLNPSLYRALEATAADALALAAMTGSAGPQGTAYSAASIITGVNVSERQIRRKADSMCRNVTDLCIALCEGKADLASPLVRPSPASTFRFQADTPQSRYGRRPSDETEEPTLRSSPSRTFTRLDNRRSSLLGLGLNTSVANSPRESSAEPYGNQDSSPSQGHVDYAARYNRPGTNLLRSRTSRFDDQSDDPTIRAPSRAMTEVGQMRSRRSDMPPRSPGLREALAARRTTSDIPEERTDEPVNSPSGITRGPVLGRARAPSEAGSLAPEKRRRRITSLEQYTPSPRLGGEPMRTSSISRRRNVLAD
ncbi:hypothetical protein BDV97DRAFT_373596 [Delphinella strobiligena]|nr:hypothetical protein BDV97DRAFT_373596 [Delphinella strobiligena]